MKSITISAGPVRYQALVGRGLLASIGTETGRVLRPTRCAVLANHTTGELFGEAVLRSLKDAGFTPALIQIPVGESTKSLEETGRICDNMSAAKLDRTSFLIALGGGVVGDLGGFAAAIYHRGIPYVQAPTTLLAQVDSAIGGKTAVNTRAGKNLLGAVHQPALVIADVDTLQTLPPREFKQGFAEIIKHAIIADPAIFDLLADFDPSQLTELVARNIEIKAAIVARDEHDVSGARAVLNFGHTVGHAIERAAGYGAMFHGEAISIGIMAACEVSMQKAGLSGEERDRVVAALRRFDLPTCLPSEISRAEILSALRSDKKFEHGEVRFVVTPRLGTAHLSREITLGDIEAAIAAL